MNNKFKIISVIVIAFLYSCDDVLNTRPVSSLTPDIAFETGDDAEAGILGVYNRLLNALGGGNRFFIYGEFRADGVQDDLVGWQDLNRSQLTPTMGQSNWSPFYQVINGANQIIEIVPNINNNITEEKRNQIIAEAHFLRALSYFWLVRVWGEVPLTTEAITSVSQELQLPKSPVSDIFSLIEEDINIAINDLPVNYSSNLETRGRATIGAAHALNAHVTLWIAQRENGGEEYLNNAIESADYIINNPLYELVDSFESVFRDETTSEYIFTMLYDNGYQQTNSFESNFLVEPLANRLRSHVQFTQIIHDHVTNNPNDNRTDVYYREKRPDDLVQNPFCVKFQGKTFDSQGYSNSDSNIPLFRFSDILLLKAEALNKLGNIEEAVALVNQVRERAGLGVVSALTEEEAIEVILYERLIELISEGHRFFDLVRNGKATELQYVMSEEHILWPVHIDELTQNPNLEQNSYY